MARYRYTMINSMAEGYSLFFKRLSIRKYLSLMRASFYKRSTHKPQVISTIKKQKLLFRELTWEMSNA